LLISEKSSPLYQRSKKPNAFQIAQVIIEKARSLGIDSGGLKSIDRKITEALKIIEEENP
jgi:hypothetical protein